MTLKKILNSPVTLKECIVTSFFITFFFFTLQYRIADSLRADEGFLWYGSVRTALGDVPIRDFHSYQPGRYYWSAFWSYIFGDSIIALRASTAIFQWIGLFFAFISLRGINNKRGFLLLVGLTITSCIMPHYKSFDAVIPVIGIFFLSNLIKNNSEKNNLILGVFTGFSAVMGANHGVYILVASLVTISIINTNPLSNRLFKSLSYFFIGVTAGFMPTIMMTLFIDGFFSAWVFSIERIFIYGTNLQKPFIWPWEVGSLKDFNTSILFITLPVMYIVTIILYLKDNKHNLTKNGLLIASAIIGLVYVHRIYSRGTMFYLASCMPPFIILISILPYCVKNIPSLVNFSFKHSKIRYALIILIICGISISDYNNYFSRSDKPIEVAVGENILKTKRTGNADFINSIMEKSKKHIPDDATVFLAPNLPQYYVMMGKKSPTWEIYYVYPEPEFLQLDTIKQIEQNNTQYAIVGNIPWDRREELKFKFTNHLVWDHIQANFQIVEFIDESKNFALYKRKN